jgi:hypothetical protein
MKRLLYLFVFVTFAGSLVAQNVVSGRVINSETRKPVPMVQISLDGFAIGTIADSSGYFKINVPLKKGVLQFYSLGYAHLQKRFQVKNKKRNLGTILLTPSTYSLDEITVNASLADKRTDPVAITEISSKVIKNRLGDRPLPLIFNFTPSVFSVRTGGGYGDAQMSIRGFKQENVGILLNGVPVNGEENGLVYWSNWQSLADVSATIQIQKGPGVANMAVNAVGGSVNIVTVNPDRTKSGMLSLGVTSYGNTILSLAINSGKMKNNWYVSFFGSYEKGNGRVDATFVNSWAYYLSATKVFNKNNKLNITLLGTPQYHGQRTLKLTKKEMDVYGYLYNKDWGGYNGEIKTASENFYHKPFLSINHYVNFDKKKTLTNSVYISYGSGGGLWSESFNYAPSIFAYRNPSGQIDWPAIYELNNNNNDDYILENGDTVSGYSKNVQTKFLASHIVAGIMPTYKQILGKGLSFKVGLNYRFFNSYLREEVYDLLGGQFFVERYAWAVDGAAGRNQIMMPGDIISVDNNSIINFIGGYFQLLFQNNHFKSYLSLNGNSNFYKRIDRYNYINNTKSELVTKPGFDVRAGVAYNFNLFNKLYFNGAYFSKAPYFKYVFGNFTNTPVQNLENEKIGTAEAGYVFDNGSVNFSVDGYITSWKNVSLLSNEYIQLEDNSQSRAMVNGLNSLHKGIEMEAAYKFHNGWKLSAFASFGDFKWKNNVQAVLFNDNNAPVDTVYVYVKNLFVGGTAQHQLGARVFFRIFKLINFNAEWIWFNKLYANFDPVNRNNAEDLSQPYRFPSYNVVNLYLNIPFNVGKKTATFDLGLYNILNDYYIETGDDGIDHNLETFRGFWSQGFTFNAKISFWF